MNVVSKSVLAFADFMLINAVLLPFSTFEPLVWAWYSLCVALAFVLRLGMEHKKHRLTKSSLLIQSIYTISWSFFMILIWNTFLNYNKGFEVYLFVNSLFSVFMVSQFEVIFELGLKEWVRVKLGKFLATEKATTTPTEGDNL